MACGHGRRDHRKASDEVGGADAATGMAGLTLAAAPGTTS
jgi:hypothetical protein